MEIVQDIFCNLWRRRADFELKTSLKAYFAMAVKYEIINRIAQKKRKDSLIERYADEYTEEDLSTLHMLSYKDLEAKLEQSILLHPERCQLFFKLKCNKDYYYKNVANDMNISAKYC